MMRGEERRLSRRELKKLTRDSVCPLCDERRAMLYVCACGCVICSECMQRDIWGYSCNNITWTCPDCGEDRSF